MNKKAVVFTMISIVFVGLIYMSMTINSGFTMREKSLVIGNRISSIDFFIKDLEKDIERGAYIALFRSILGIQQHITSEGEFLNDTQGVFKEVMINGSIDGNYMSVMNDTELSVWISKIQVEASKIAIRFNYTINDVRVYHDNPWILSLDLNVTMNINDIKGTASWSRDQIITTTINITSFEDPLYIVNTYGRVINTIEKSNITDFTDGDDTTNLLEHIDNSYYIESNSSPSFLLRLSGNLSNSTYGIESIVNLKSLEDVSLIIEDKSCVDYIYFSSQNPASYSINNTYNWFKMDNVSNHLEVYEVAHLVE